MWEVLKWLYDVSLEESWMTLLTPLNKTELMRNTIDHTLPISVYSIFMTLTLSPSESARLEMNTQTKTHAHTLYQDHLAPIVFFRKQMWLPLLNTCSEALTQTASHSQPHRPMKWPLLSTSSTMFSIKSFHFILITLILTDMRKQSLKQSGLTCRRVSILRLHFEIFLFLVSEERAVPSIRTASIDCFHPLPSFLLALVPSLLPLSLALSLSFSFFLTGKLLLVEVVAWTVVPLSPSVLC